jgi:hypothetical protein
MRAHWTTNPDDPTTKTKINTLTRGAWGRANEEKPALGEVPSNQKTKTPVRNVPIKANHKHLAKRIQSHKPPPHSAPVAVPYFFYADPHRLLH